MLDKTTYPFPNFNCANLKFWNGNVISYPTLCGASDYLSMLGLKLIRVNKVYEDKWRPAAGILAMEK